jgi:type II secretory pathway component PulK
VNFTGALLSDNLKKGKLQDNLEQREWQLVPIMTGSDTELRVRWEDERSKININTIDSSPWINNLFEDRRVGVDALGRISTLKIETQGGFFFVSELHKVMTDEDCNKVANYLTVNSDNIIDVNTASEDVLSAVLKGKNTSPTWVVANRKDGPIQNLAGTDINSGEYATTSDIFRVYSYATVGGYTKQIEAVIKRTNSGFTVMYWKAL